MERREGENGKRKSGEEKWGMEEEKRKGGDE